MQNTMNPNQETLSRISLESTAFFNLLQLACGESATGEGF